MRKPVFAICEQQRRRSACASAQSDQRLCCSLSRYYNSSSFYIQNFKRLPSFCGCAGWFESFLIGNPEGRFSRDKAHIQWNKVVDPCTKITLLSTEIDSSEMSQLMRLWHFSSSVNSLFKRACAAIQWGWMSDFWPDTLSTSTLQVCEQPRLWRDRADAQAHPSLR